MTTESENKNRVFPQAVDIKTIVPKMWNCEIVKLWKIGWVWGITNRGSTVNKYYLYIYYIFIIYIYYTRVYVKGKFHNFTFHNFTPHKFFQGFYFALSQKVRKMYCFRFPNSVVPFLPLFCDSHPSFLTSPHLFFVPLVLKIYRFSCKTASPLEYPVGTKKGLKMEGASRKWCSEHQKSGIERQKTPT